MHKFLLIVFLSVLVGNAFSQQQYFIYIQSEDQQPFYVRINDKIFSSTETGYLILSKLTNKNYDLLIGFARNIYPEQHFKVPLDKKDKGFQLKNYGEKGWGLVNLQNQEVIMHAGLAPVNADLTGVRKTDPFSVMLAGVVNDTAILYTVVRAKPTETVPEKKPAELVKKETKKEENKNALTKEEELIAAESIQNLPKIKDSNNYKLPESTSVPVYAQKKDSSVHTGPDSLAKGETVSQPVLTKTEIIKYKEEQSTSMYQVTYLEKSGANTDTIHISIPIEQVIAKEVIPESEKKVSETVAENKETAKRDSNSVIIQMGSVIDTVMLKKPKIVMINSDCKNFAADNDVDKLRIKLLGEKSTEEKLTTAKKVFRSKCFTVRQIRALTELFSTDEAKYQFLDVAYAFASDSGNYYLLEEVISEDYYRNRFRAMIRK